MQNNQEIYYYIGVSHHPSQRNENYKTFKNKTIGEINWLIQSKQKKE